MRKYKFEKKNLYKSIDFDRNDEKHWKFGMIYCNPEDPLMFVAGRGRWGTPNFGHKVIKILMVISVSFVIACFLLLNVLVEVLQKN